MPKKAAKNAYFYFMIDFREEQKKKGVNYANLTEVQQAADPVWRAAHPSIRTKYENIAKQEKAKHNVPDQKFTSFGVPFSEIEHQERMAKEAVETELKYIQNFVRQNTINKKILDQDIYLIDLNAMCETKDGYVFGEVTILRFNIRDGIKDHMHELINPPMIPLGYASDIKLGCEQFALDTPDPDLPKTNYMQLLSGYVDFLKDSDPTAKVIPPLYTMPEKVDQALDFIAQICRTSLEDERIFRVYKLDLLFFYVINTLKNTSDEGFPRESLALAALRKDVFKYTPRIACVHHDSKDRCTECTMSRAKRWAFTVLDSCCPVAGVPAVPGCHVPEGTDIEAVLEYKEAKKEQRRLPEARAPSSCSSRDGYGDYQTPTYGGTSPWAKPAQTLQPLRKPKAETIDFQHSSIVPAPELSESDFPPLNLGSGRGSGRIAAHMKNLNLKK